MFLVGFLDDLKINIKPLTRLIIMVALLFLIIYILPIKIFNIDIPFLIPLMSSHIFSSLFVLLCFLFVINGANLIDGFNGLLAINLIIMVLLLFLFIYILPIKIFNIDIPFLIPLMSSHVFSSFFVLLCFLFVINGANLIDGFNGLLAINLIIINIILTSINMNSNNLEFSILLISQIIILLSFLLFNFPSAKIFLGDSGAYVFGALTSLNTIITNNLNPKISSFFFCSLLFYLFF